MQSPIHARFLRIVALLSVCVMVVVGIVAPSNAFVLLLYAVPLSVVAVVLAYLLT